MTLTCHTYPRSESVGWKVFLSNQELRLMNRHTFYVLNSTIIISYPKSKEYYYTSVVLRIYNVSTDFHNSLWRCHDVVDTKIGSKYELLQVTSKTF